MRFLRGLKLVLDVLLRLVGLAMIGFSAYLAYLWYLLLDHFAATYGLTETWRN